MDERPNPAPAYRFANPREARIHRRLLLLGDGPASFYLDACQIRAERSLSTAIHLIAHCFREIEGSLRDVLLPTDYSVPEEQKKETHRAKIDTILGLYGFADDDPVAAAWRSLAGRESELSPHRQAHRDALAAPRSIDEPSQQSFIEVMEAMLDGILEKYEKRFLDYRSQIDELLSKHPPTAKDAQTLRTRIPNNPITLAEFFDRVEDSAWLDLLAAEGYFRRPPNPIIDPETHTARLPNWPESRYLVRMARVLELQERVAELALAVPGTANSYVVQELVEVALALPPHLGALFASKTEEWLDLPYPSVVPVKFAELAMQLAGSGETERALTIMRSLLLPVSDQGEERPRSTKAKARFEDWAYGAILRDAFPAFNNTIGTPAFELLCEALERAIQLSQADGAQQPKDYSYLWRPAIEEHEQNQDYGDDVRYRLVSAVRDAAERVAQSGAGAVCSLLDVLGRYRWNVFRRIELHVLRTASEAPRDLVAQRLTDRALFEESDVWHEYSLLASSKFPELLPEEQTAVLGWIEQGPDLVAYAARQESETGTRPTGEQLAEDAKQWQIRHIARMVEALPSSWRERHSELVTESLRLEHPDLPAYMGTWLGPTSPLTTEDLGRMSVEEIVLYCKRWRPKRGFAENSPEGLGRTLSAAIAAEPERFAQEARLLHGLEPTYVRGFLSGLREAARAKRVFTWGPTLDLCEWVIEQGVDTEAEAEERTSIADRDPSWGWTRQEIAHLVAMGLRDDPLEIPIAHRQQVWNILRALTDDPEPDLEYEAKYGSTNMGPSELSINTTRGNAMHAAIQYGLWVKRQLEPDSQRGLDTIPELRDVLDRHLDTTVDPTTTVRSVYGRWLPTLFVLDDEWARSQLTRIFPQQEELFEAAWDGYTRYNWAISALLPLLANEYMQAIEQLGSKPESRRSLAVERNLAEHLMVFYLRGKLELNDPLLIRFFAQAPASVRAHALSYVGRVAHNDEDLEEPMFSRMRALWEDCRNSMQADPAAHTEELQSFGWWFASGKFDEEWAFAELIEVLRVVSVGKADELVLAKLEERTERAPLQVAECVRLLVEGAREHWRIFSWRAEVREILRKLLSSTTSEARAKGRDIVNILAAKGYVEFADLVE